MPRRILYVQYTNPAAYPPLLHSAALLAEAGWEVLFIGIPARGAASLAIPAHERVKYVELGGASGGVLGPLKYASFAAQAVVEAKRFRPDWIYASDTLSTPAALMLRQFTGSKVVYHEHDAPSRAVQGAAVAARKARDQLARNADIVVAPAAARLAMIPAGTGRRFVVWNCPRLTEVAAEQPANEVGSFKLVYHGSLSRDRLTPEFVGALALLPEHVELHIFGYETQGHRAYPADLLDRARRAGVAQRVRYHGAIPARQELLRRLRGHNLGISTIVADSIDENLQTLAGASNKAFEYLASGMPVLVSEHAEWRKMFVAPGYGVACHPTDAASIAAAVRPLVDDPGRAIAMGTAGRARVAQEWNYETQFAPVLAALLS